MRIDIWLRDGLTIVPGQAVTHRNLTSWDDPTSPGPLAAAERAWRVCSWDLTDLDLEEQVWRANFDDAARGARLSVGDIVVAGGVALRCDPTGFSPVEAPASLRKP